MKTKRLYLTLFLSCLIAAVVLAGCASVEWQPVTLKDEGDICWPQGPDCKVRYAGEIRAFEPTGRSLLTIIAGKSPDGKILRPVAVTMGPDGCMAIADQARQGVHLYTPARKEYRMIAMAGKQERLASPVGVAFDDAANLYVTDSQINKIVIYDANGNYLKSISEANGKPLGRPTGITFNPLDNRLYVSDTLSHRILVFSRLGEFITAIGSRGEKTGSLNFPTHLGSDPAGNIYISDSMNFRAQIHNPDNGMWSAFGHHGNGSGDFASPKGIDADANGFIYVAETLFDNVQIFDRKGTYLLGIGSQGNGPGQFWMPSGLFIDPASNLLYVCDTYNQRIQIFELLTGTPSQKTPMQRGAVQ
ncbi:MAG: 6-bladed beta-propeller [Pseudomonadota bacterium]